MLRDAYYPAPAVDIHQPLFNTWMFNTWMSKSNTTCLCQSNNGFCQDNGLPECDSTAKGHRADVPGFPISLLILLG